MLDVFDPPFMQRALLAGLILAVPLGLIGTWAVLRALAFFSHAVGVGTFPGVVLGLGIPAIGPFVGAAAAAGVLTGVVVGLERDERVRGGAITGLALSAAMALGAVLLTTTFGIAAPVEAVLFGSLLAITDADIARAAAVAVVVTVVVCMCARRLEGVTFDRRWAQSAGVRAQAVEAALLVSLAGTVVVALPIVGSLLVSGLLIVPAATARLVTTGVFEMMVVSVALCAVETVLGLAVARELDAPPGAAISAAAGIVFAAAVLVDRARSRTRSQ